MNLYKRENDGDQRSLFKNANYSGTIEMSPERLSAFKKVLRSILKDFIQVADKEGIRYVLCGGSCLGAVRHKGFIPWDDDIDICIPRKDYNKFMAIFNKKLGDKYLLASPEKGRGHGMSHSQMKLKGTCYKSFNELSQTDSDMLGIFIDIFVMENTFDNSFLYNLHGILCLVSGYILTCRKTYEDMNYLKNYINKDKSLKRAFKKKARIGRLFKFISVDTCAHITKSVYALCKNRYSEYISIPSGREHYFGATYFRESMLNRKAARFEGLKVWIPRDYDTYLRNLYGEDYMKIPRDRQESHPIMKLEF